MTRIAALIPCFAIAMTAAHAHPKPALVQDVDANGRDVRQRAVATRGGIGESLCQRDFDAVTAGCRLERVKVSPEASVSVNSNPMFLCVATSSLPARAAFTTTAPHQARLAAFPVTLVPGSGSIPRVTVGPCRPDRIGVRAASRLPRGHPATAWVSASPSVTVVGAGVDGLALGA